jgi:hypothetical protein
MYTQKERKIIFIKVNSREKENVDHLRPPEKSADKILVQCYKILFLVLLALSVPPIDPPFVSVFCAAKTKQGEGDKEHHNSKSLSDKDKGGGGAPLHVLRGWSSSKEEEYDQIIGI